MDYADSLKLKMAEDEAMKIIELLPRLQQLIALKYLPVVLRLRGSRDIDNRTLEDEIKTELAR